MMDNVPRVGDPRVPIYLLADVARYIRLHPSTAWRWTRWIPGRDIEDTIGGLSFLDLISLQVMYELRNLGIKTRQIKRAEEYLTERLGIYPLARYTIWTDRAHIFFDPDSPIRRELPRSALESADKEGQRAFVELIRVYLQRVTYNEEGFAIAWSPADRVRLHAARQFGQPCVEGTRITTSAIYLFHKGGDTIDYIGDSFEIPIKDVSAAIDWERSLEHLVA